MKVKLVIIIIVGVVTAGCSTPAENIPPTEEIKPTVTPIPPATKTPIPPPTETPVPTATMPPPTPTTPAGKQLKVGAYDTVMYIGEAMTESLLFLAAEQVYTDLLDYEMDDPSKAEVLTNRAFVYDAVGNLGAAIQDYQEANQLVPDDEFTLYSLCWDYAITDQAEKGLPYCEDVVSLSPDPYYVDGRGIAYALLGKYEEAIQDFEVVVEYLQDYPNLESILETRLAWLETLEGGENPFTPDVLLDLQNEYTVLVSEPPIYIPEEVDFSRSGLRARFEETGFIFRDLETENGEEMVIGNYEDGICKEGVKLVGPEAEIVSASLSVTGCTDDYTQGEASWFLGLFFSEGDEIVDAPYTGKIFSWTITEVYYVIEGMEPGPVSTEIENITFTAAPIPDEKYSLEIYAAINP